MAHPVRPDEYLEINNFYTAHRVREGRRGHPHAAHAARARALPPRHGPLLRAPRRPGRHLRRLRAGDAGRVRRRPHAVPALVRAGRHAGARACAARYDAAARTLHAATSRSARRRRRASRPSCRSTSRSRSAWSAPTAATCRCASRARRRRWAPRACSTFATSAADLHLRRRRPRRRCRRCCAASRRRSSSSSTTRDDDLALLAAHDSDPVNRWDAAQRSFARAILALAQAHGAGQALALPASLAGIVARAARRPRQRSRRCSRWR